MIAYIALKVLITYRISSVWNIWFIAQNTKVSWFLKWFSSLVVFSCAAPWPLLWCVCVCGRGWLKAGAVHGDLHADVCEQLTSVALQHGQLLCLGLQKKLVVLIRSLQLWKHTSMAWCGTHLKNKVLRLRPLIVFIRVNWCFEPCGQYSGCLCLVDRKSVV